MAPHVLLDELLGAAIEEATGVAGLPPRPAQAALSHDVLDRMLAVGQPSTSTSPVSTQCLAGAPTGVGKGIAYLTPLFASVIVAGQRGIVSTESLALQSQLLDKDAPAVAAACQKVLGERPSFALLKGWANYGCPAKASSTAAQLLNLDEDSQTPATMANLSAMLRAALGQPGGLDAMTVDEKLVDPATLSPLTAWALDSAGDHFAHGDRYSFEGSHTQGEWESVSVSTDDCVGRDNCPFAGVCIPGRAHDRAAEADVVITNHAMLAVQAANSTPVVLGSPRLGHFDHLVLDEAHVLPAQVRNAGARAISAPRVMTVVRLLHRHCQTSESVVGSAEADRMADQLVQTGERLAGALDRALDAKIAPARRGSRHGAPVLGLKPDDEDPLGGMDETLRSWARQVSRVLPADNGGLPSSEAIKLRRARSVLERFVSDLDGAVKHEVGHARWVQDGDPTHAGRWVGASLRTSPVDVADAIGTNLFLSDVIIDRSDDSDPWGQVPDHRWTQEPDEGSRRPPRYRLSVTAVSATLPSSFAFESGMDVKAVEHPSPFADAYAGSALYIPMVTAAAEALAFTKTWPGASKPSFDTARHPEWALGQLLTLVAANGGRALVLAATVKAGKTYADALRIAIPGVTVHSQWDGRPVRHSLDAWRNEETSVLVGTKSLMTGVDAPGQTCSLVVLDRVPRNAGNPVDDARVEAVMSRLSSDRWVADRMVYVADAALLLAQATGRLVRSTADTGMVAVLDPRLLKFGVLTYQGATREALMRPLRVFGSKFSDLGSASAWLSAHRAARVPGAAALVTAGARG